MSPSSFEERAFPSMRAIMEHSSHSDDQLGESTPQSGHASVVHSGLPSRSLANTSASILSSCIPNGHQAPPAPPQSVQSATVPQSEPDLHSANDRLIENPRNSPTSSIQGRGSINLTNIDRRLEALKLNRATSTEVLDFTSERGVEFSSSPIEEMAARRRQSEMLSSEKPALQSTDGVREHGDWKDEIISGLDHAFARLSQLAHDDHDRNPSVSIHSHFTQHLTAALNRLQLPLPDSSELQVQLREMSKLYNDQAKTCYEQASALNELAKANNEQAKTCSEHAKTVSKLAMVLANSKE